MSKYTNATYTTLKKSNEPYLVWGENDEAEALGAAVIGTAPTPLGPVAVYDSELLVEHFLVAFAAGCAEQAHAECDHETEALEWVGFNITGAWIGDRTPITLARFCDEHELQSAACSCPLSEFDSWWEKRVSEAEKRGLITGHEGKVG